MEKINDFGISFSTVNGSGSATANNTILKAIFKMGIPVSARNIFPSNIQGMPTWYELRVSEKGYLGRREKKNILVAMNPETAQADLDCLTGDGMLLVNENLHIAKIPKGITVHKMPVDRILAECSLPQNLNIYLANMVYVGTLAYLIGIDLEKIGAALDQHFNGHRSAIEPNLVVVDKAYRWAQENIGKQSRFLLKSCDLTQDKIMIDGNTSAALGALYGGLQFAAWYPITPATSLAESLNEYIPRLRTDPETGDTTCVVVQAEDELAAVGMVVGAGWAGLRSMTSTSGPGLCLMAETIGLAYFAEVPIVIWDVQRVGPSTGLPTRTSQGDLAFAASISHGDKDIIVLLPNSVGECFDFGWQAMDIAEQLQTPLIILSDLDLGMNIWMTDNLKYPNKKIQRGKVLWEKDLEKLIKKGKDQWGRYKDLDGDGIAYRTVPGNLDQHAAYFTRGTGHDEYANYSEESSVWEDNLLRLKKKFVTAKGLLPEPEVIENGGKVGVITFGSSMMPVIEAVDMMLTEKKPVELMCIKAIPFSDRIGNFLESHQKVMVVEANRDGQMKDLLCMHYPQYAQKLVSAARCDGLALSVEWIISQIEEMFRTGDQ